MANRPREKSKWNIYHIYVHGISNEKIFNQTREKNYFKRIIRECKDEFEIEIYAYCIMSNHSHLIVRSELKELSKFMSKILTKYAKYYNYKHNRNGHVFQNRFGSECIEDERYLLNCLRYVHMNPVKACMVPAVTDYRHSSIKEYQSGKNDILHENAINYYKSKFKDWTTFLEYHHLPNAVVLLDTKEAVYEQLQDQAMLLLWEFQEANLLDNAVEVLEEPMIREAFKDELKVRLNISSEKREKLYSELKKKLIG